MAGYGMRDGEYTVRARPFVRTMAGSETYGEWKELTITLERFTFDADGSFGVAWEGGTASYLLLAESLAASPIQYYTLDVNGDGAFDVGMIAHDEELGGALEWEVPLPAVMLPADNGQYTSRVRVFGGGYFGWQEYEVDLSIGNMPARINIAAEHGLLPGGTLSVAISTSDPGPDTVTSLTIDWGDGSSPVTITGNTAALDHLYEDAGDYTITVTATDEDGSYTSEHLLAVYVPLAPEPDWIHLVSSIATISEDGLSATLEVEAISDATGTNVGYEWDYVLDGSYQSGSGTIVLTRTSVYEPFRVALRVRDGAGHVVEWLMTFQQGGFVGADVLPTPSNYRKIFLALTKEIPTNWEVHHLYQVVRDIDQDGKASGVLYRRFLQGNPPLNVNSMDLLRGVDPAIHKEISKTQVKWWAEQKRKLGVTTVREAAELVDLNEYKAFADQLRDDFEPYMVKVGASRATAKAAINAWSKGGAAKMTRTKIVRWTKYGIITVTALGALQIFDLFAKAERAMASVQDHSPDALAKLARVDMAMERCFDDATGTAGRVKRVTFEGYHKAMREYAVALHMPEEVVSELDLILLVANVRHLEE